MATSDRLDGIGDQVPRLERVTHAERAHRDPVRDGRRPEPVPRDAGIGERFLDPGTESQDVLVASVEFRVVSIVAVLGHGEQIHPGERGEARGCGLRRADLRVAFVPVDSFIPRTHRRDLGQHDSMGKGKL